MIALLIAIPITLSGCGGSSDQDTTQNIDTSGKLSYESNDFKILYPQDWEVISPSNFTSNVPSEIMIAFRNNIKNEVFTANVNVSKTTLGEDISSQDFAISSSSKIQNTIVSYQLIGKTDYQFIGPRQTVETYIIDFEGKKAASEAIIHFKNLYIVDNKIGYIVTGAYLPSEDESVVKSISDMLESFSIK